MRENRKDLQFKKDDTFMYCSNKKNEYANWLEANVLRGNVG